LRYVANTHASHSLYPQDPAARTQVERWMDWTLASLNPAYLAGFKEAKLAPEEQTEATSKLLSNELSLLDGHLAGREWVSGETFSLADICLAPIVRRCLNFPHNQPELPHLRNWMARIETRPAFATAVAAG